MTRRIAIIQVHPDPAGHHPLHATADAYAEAAIAARHEARRIEAAKLEFPLLSEHVPFHRNRRAYRGPRGWLLRKQADFETGVLLVQPLDEMRWAEHWANSSLS